MLGKQHRKFPRMQMLPFLCTHCVTSGPSSTLSSLYFRAFEVSAFFVLARRRLASFCPHTAQDEPRQSVGGGVKSRLAKVILRQC